MVVGFNHNFNYKGAVYHIQTEDNGLRNPTIVTLLYHGGTILASRKTSYADITRVDNLEQVVEELMKEQHKGMLRSLKNGEFDEVITRYQKGVKPAAPAANAAGAGAPPVSPSAPQPPPRPSAPAPPAAKPVEGNAAVAATSLDEVVLSYLLGKDK